MNNEPLQPRGPQSAQTTDKTHRARRITDIMPVLREKITDLFDRGVTIDRMAKDLSIPPVQVLEHIVRDYAGAKHPGPVRRPVASETVREFRIARRVGA